MNLPGLSFLREQSALRQFESQDASFRDLVFYSEGTGDWPHLGPVIEALLRDHERNISYLTSNPADPGMGIQHPRFRPFQIGAGTVRTILFARIDCGHFVMTLPDLGNLWLKRSVHPVHYVYLFHSINSTHTAYRKGAFDAYDTILCVGPHHVHEIRKTEALYGLPAKELIEHGSAKLDTILERLADLPPAPKREPITEVLVAPTWGDSSLIERPVGHELIETLVRGGYHTVLRLHPMTVRRIPELLLELKQRYRSEPLFRLEDDMNATESWMRSDLMISDWSGAAIEYAFSMQKPVIYVNTPEKILNPQWQAIDAPPFEENIRGEIGVVVEESDVGTIPTLIRECSQQGEAVAKRIRAARSRWIYNVGVSSRAAAAYFAPLRRKDD